MAKNDSDYPWQDIRDKSRGSFIVVEGLDRAGKTTQVKMLCDVSIAANLEEAIIEGLLY